MCKDFDLMDIYDGIDFNDKQFEEAVRQIENEIANSQDNG